jgi:hypothetical protein
MDTIIQNLFHHRGTEVTEEREFLFAGRYRQIENAYADPRIFVGQRPGGLWRIGISPILHKISPSVSSVSRTSPLLLAASGWWIIAVHKHLK